MANREKHKLGGLLMFVFSCQKVHVNDFMTTSVNLMSLSLANLLTGI